MFYILERMIFLVFKEFLVDRREEFGIGLLNILRKKVRILVLWLKVCKWLVKK